MVVEDNPRPAPCLAASNTAQTPTPCRPDHASIHAGSLLKAHGGFILLHLHDLAAEEGACGRLRAFCAAGAFRSKTAAVAACGSRRRRGGLQPEPDVDVKIVLIGSVEGVLRPAKADPDAAAAFA